MALFKILLILFVVLPLSKGEVWTQLIVNSTYNNTSGVTVQSTISVTGISPDNPVYACVNYTGSAEPNSIQIVVNDGTGRSSTECSSSCSVSTEAGFMSIRFQYTQKSSIFDIWPQGEFKFDLNTSGLTAMIMNQTASPSSMGCGGQDLHGTIDPLPITYVFEYSVCSMELSSIPECFQATGEYYTFYINVVATDWMIKVNAKFAIQIQDSHSPIYICESHQSNKPWQWPDAMMITSNFDADMDSYKTCTHGCEIDDSKPEYNIHFLYQFFQTSIMNFYYIDIWKNMLLSVSKTSIMFKYKSAFYNISTMSCNSNGWINKTDTVSPMFTLTFNACANPTSSLINCESTENSTLSTTSRRYSSTTTGGYSSTASKGYSSTTSGGYSSTTIGRYSSTTSGGYLSTTSRRHPSTASKGYSSTTSKGYSSTTFGGYSSTTEATTPSSNASFSATNFSTYSSTIPTTSPSTTPTPIINCTHPETESEKIYCDILNGTQPQPGNISAIMNATLNIFNMTDITGKNLSIVIGIFDTCSKVKSMKQEDFHGMASFLDHLISAPLLAYKTGNDNNQNIGTLLLDSITQMMINSPPVVSYLSGNNIALIGRPVHCNSSNPNLYGISDHGGSFGETPNKDTVASISIDPITACQVNTERVFYSVYRSQKFFVGNSTHSSGLLQGNNFVFKKPAISDATTSTTVTDYNNKCAKGFLKTDESVVSATATTSKATKFARVKEFEGNFIIHKVLVDGEEKTLVNMKFSKKHYGVSLHGKMKTTWFDVSTNSWSRNTCDVKEKDGFYESSCNHLTDFTLIVDGSALDPILCNTTLEVVNYLVAIGSLVCLIILNTIYIGLVIPIAQKSSIGQALMTYLPKNNEDYSVTVYNFLQLIFFFNFVIFSNEGRTTGKGGCTAVAIVNYWVLMSCVMLSLFQSWKILKNVAWTTGMENFFKKITSPLFIYILTFAIPTLLAIGFGAGTKLDFFYRNDSFCWIRSDFITAGVVIPLTILGVNAIICSFIITLKFFPGLKIAGLVRGSSIIISRGAKRDVKERVIALFFTQFTLGVPWLLQYMTLFTPSVTASHYLFSVINGSQGIILLCSFSFRCYSIMKSKGSQYQMTKANETNNQNLNRFPLTRENQQRSNLRPIDWLITGETVTEKANKTRNHIQQKPELIPRIIINRKPNPFNNYDIPPDA